MINCICATNPNCRSSAPIYNFEYDSDDNCKNSSLSYIVPGLIEGCSTIDSLLLSNFQCLYSHSDCFSRLKLSLKSAYVMQTVNPSWFDVRPLVSNPQLTRFFPNTSMGDILKNIMIEKWNPSFSYKQFYEACAPSYCTYSQKIHTKTFFEVIIAMMSIIAGLTVSLRLITPYLVKFIFSVTKRRQQQQQQQQGNCYSQLLILKEFEDEDVMNKILISTLYCLIQVSLRFFL